MKFTKYKLIPLISLVALNFILTLILFVIEKENREQIVYLWVLSIVPFLFLCLCFKAQEVLNVNHYAPVIFLLMSIIANIVSIVTFRKITLEETVNRVMPVSAFVASLYWVFLRPKEKQAEENKKLEETKEKNEKTIAILYSCSCSQSACYFCFHKSTRFFNERNNATYCISVCHILYLHPVFLNCQKGCFTAKIQAACSLYNYPRYHKHCMGFAR